MAKEKTNYGRMFDILVHEFNAIHLNTYVPEVDSPIDARVERPAL